MNSYTLPDELQKIIATKKTDFIIKNSKQQSIRKTIPALIFTLMFICVLSFIIYKFVNPIIATEIDNSKFTSNNFILMIPAISLGVLSVIGIGLLIKTIKLFFTQTSYFIGTDNKLIIYKNNTITEKEWNEFSGKTTVRQKNNYGDLILELKSTKNNTIIIDEDIYNDVVEQDINNDTIEIINIRNVLNIEHKCLYRIEKNNT